LISKARVLDESKIDVSKVLIYSIVKIKNLKNNAEMTYTIVPESEADLKGGKISVSSPIAKALIGNSTGDVVAVQAPAGVMEFKILDVSR
jgi:transcription elongation factor GreA